MTLEKMLAKNQPRELQNQVKNERTPIQPLEQIEQGSLSELMVRLKATEGYLSTFLKENMNKEIAITSELEIIKKTSLQVQEQMKLTSIKSIDNLKDVNETYTKHINKNMNTLANMIQKMEQELKANGTLIQNELKMNKKLIQDELKEIKENYQKSLNELNVTSQNYLKQQRTGLAINGWLDVLKYGLPTAIFVVGMQYLIKLVLGGS